MLYLLKFQLTRSRGAWLFYSASLQTILHFNSHAHVERDRLTTPKNSVTIISTHTLTWSVTTWEKKEAWHKIFQLTRSRGAWLRCTSLSDLHELFQLTRSRGAWPAAHRGEAVRGDFNSHAHVERDARLTRIWKINVISTHTLTWSVTTQERQEKEQERHFNSHAHVERDHCNDRILHTVEISTHTLTWSVTYLCNEGARAEIISTHTLTWSVTREGIDYVFCWQFQLTRSRGAWRFSEKLKRTLSNFNSHAHVELTSRR